MKVIARNSNLLEKITVFFVICCLGTAAIGSPYASNPSPPDGLVFDAVLTILSWHPGDYAVSHDIYFGTNFEDVNNNDPAAFKKNTTGTSELVLGLVRGQNYYWRINEVNEAHMDSPWYGDVWNFKIRGYKASEPNPPDGARHVSLDPLFEWSPGAHAAIHFVYFGTDYDDVNTADTDSTEFRAYVGAPDSNWSPLHDGGLSLQADNYYWRIDESPDGVTIYKGDVWSFDTFPALLGSGIEEDPWRIQSLEDFDEFARDTDYWADYTRLETDVNLAGRVYDRAVIAWDINDVEGGFQGTAFTGVFDGNNHKITNLTIEGGDNDYVGFFGSIPEGSVKNLDLEAGSISGQFYVGGLIGKHEFGSVLNCHCTCDVSGFVDVGGLVGDGIGGKDGNISNCSSAGHVGGSLRVGGLVGRNFSTISACCSTGDVNGVDDVGGLVGKNQSEISSCHSSGDVNGVDDVGGLVGQNLYSVLKSYSTGDVSGEYYVGGLVGYNDGGDISNCYSTGDVIADYGVGGLVGVMEYGLYVSNCYSTGDVNGNDYVGGLVGYNDGYSISNCFWDTDTQTHGVTESIGDNQGTATNVAGLPTDQMQTIRTFTDADWDFINVWNIGENQTYPYLRIYLAGDINKDGIVNFLDIAITANQWMEEK